MSFTFARSLSLLLLTTSLCGASSAEVNCKIGGREIRVAEAISDFNYSAKGVRGASSGKVSHFRLITIDDGDGPTSGIELKTVDVTALGEYALSTESLWRSNFRLNDKDQNVTTGRFNFTRFEMQGSRGRAAGTVEFASALNSGSCSFNVEVMVLNRDRLTGG